MTWICAICRKFREIFTKMQLNHDDQQDTRNIVCNELYSVYEAGSLIIKPHKPCNPSYENNDFGSQLFVENRCYDIDKSSTVFVKPDDQHIELEHVDEQRVCEKYQELTAEDLLHFAKQIATGMVRVNARSFVSCWNKLQFNIFGNLISKLGIPGKQQNRSPRSCSSQCSCLCG